MALEIIEARPPEGRAAGAVPFLFVHGAWHGAWCWAERFLPYVAARGHDAYAVSLRGHGRSLSPRPLWRTSLRDYVEDVASAVERVGGRPILVGHSMGGLVVQRYLANGGRAAAGVLLAAVPPTGVLPTTLRIARRHPLAFFRANLSASLWPIVATPALAREALLHESTDPETAAGVHARLQDEAYFAYLGMLAPRIDPSRVRVPMLVIGAGADRMFTPAEIHATARAYGVEAQIVDGAAHDLMLDPAWERVAAQVVDWVERGPGPRPL
ncbi:MAG TPA: alpha/beta fold hydrolase [Anaeromyxobacteraceae bacterium]|nr:alpha/beta fold hydrolase [Anaeromyxobacteraceae bacterium]